MLDTNRHIVAIMPSSCNNNRRTPVMKNKDEAEVT